MANIIIVDDDYAMELIVENLRQRGHEVHRVSSVDEALRDADRIAGCDLVVLDLIMPQSRELVRDNPDGARSMGMLVYRELRRRRSNLPILSLYCEPRPSPREVIEADSHARYSTRWSSPKFGERVATARFWCRGVFVVRDTVRANARRRSTVTENDSVREKQSTDIRHAFILSSRYYRDAIHKPTTQRSVVAT